MAGWIYVPSKASHPLAFGLVLMALQKVRFRALTLPQLFSHCGWEINPLTVRLNAICWEASAEIVPGRFDNIVGRAPYTLPYLAQSRQKRGPRYAKWRSDSGSLFWLTSLFKVFLLQALFLWVIALTIN